jgi:SAM-dependent methyltransferase
MSLTYTFPSLLDPTVCGEDRLVNLQRAVRIAPSRCVGCADYHIRCCALRCIGEKFGIESDRPELIALVRELVAARLAGPGGVVDIVIPGSADTGILATAAHAVATLGGEALARCRFTVLDLCPTPLALCKAFADAHGLAFASAEIDLTAPAERFPADLILLHSVFRFIAAGQQRQAFETVGSWLKPGGALLFSHRVKSASAVETEADIAKRKAANRRFEARLASGDILLDADHLEIVARLDRSVSDGEARLGEFRDAAAVRAFLEGSALRLSRFQTMNWEIGEDGRQPYRRQRVLAVLTPEV